MNVFRHDHISQDNETIPHTNLFEDFQKQISAARTASSGRR
jgi:hypothetical protein